VPFWSVPDCSRFLVFESNRRELTGSLRDFAIGAIIQHLPLTLERSAFDTDENGNPRKPDFRFATEAELDALEAFMLSIGRQEENDDLRVSPHRRGKLIMDTHKL